MGALGSSLVFRVPGKNDLLVTSLVLNAGLVILGVLKEWTLLLVLLVLNAGLVILGVTKDWILLLVLNAGLVILGVMKLLLKEWTL